MNALLFAVVVVSVVVIAWWVADYWVSQKSEPTKCTGNCNQGRNCTCDTYTPEQNHNWPFPKSKP